MTKGRVVTNQLGLAWATGLTTAIAAVAWIAYARTLASYPESEFSHPTVSVWVGVYLGLAVSATVLSAAIFTVWLITNRR